MIVNWTNSLSNPQSVTSIHSFIAPKIFGGRNSATPVSGTGIDEVADAPSYELVSIDNIDGDIYAKYILGNTEKL